MQRVGEQLFLTWGIAAAPCLLWQVAVSPPAVPAAPAPGRRPSPRGDARHRQLLDSVTEDVLARGLADFSLRRAARACGTTHKVLLYHFRSVEGLLTEVAGELRARRTRAGVKASTAIAGGTLAGRVRRVWPALLGPEADALDQLMGLAMTDPDRYGCLAVGALEEYLPALLDLCPDAWSQRRKHEVAGLVLATMRGLVLTRRTSPASFDPEPVLAALERALEREESADPMDVNHVVH